MNKEARDDFYKFCIEVSNNSFEKINKRDEKGETILHYAVRISNQKTVKLLIEKGADVNAADKKATALCSISETSRKRKSTNKERSRS